jgi:hypothetical protein
MKIEIDNFGMRIGSLIDLKYFESVDRKYLLNFLDMKYFYKSGMEIYVEK